MLKYAVLLIYLLTLAVIGIISTKKSKDLNNFVLGGRNAGAWMSAFSYGTTYFSAVLFIGYAGRNGMGFGLWAVLIGIGNALLGTYLAWKILAKPTRSFTKKYKLSTMPEFFKTRYKSPNIKTFAAIIIFIFMVPYSASVYSGLSYFFETVFNVRYEYAILIMAAISALYLILGGYIATLIADFIQGIVMIGGVVLMIIFIANAPEFGGFANGFSQLYKTALENIPSLDFAKIGNMINLIALILLTSLGSWGLPQMIHKFYAISDNKAVKKGTIISTIFCLVIGGGAYLTGAFAKLFYTGKTAPASDMIIPDFLNTILPEALIGIIVVLVFSASVTTLTGIVLSSSNSLTVDLIKDKIAKNISKKNELLMIRCFCLLFIAVSVIIALIKTPIQTLMSFSWGTVSGAFLAPYLLGLYWKGVTKAGAWSGMIGGVLTSISLAVIYNFDAPRAPLFGVVAMAISLILTVSVSLFTKKFDKAEVAEMLTFEKE